jgi:hypothetical protein
MKLKCIYRQYWQFYEHYMAHYVFTSTGKTANCPVRIEIHLAGNDKNKIYDRYEEGKEYEFTF